MIEFPGNTYGLALNLERDSVGAVILGEYKHITEGDSVRCTARFWKCRSVKRSLAASWTRSVCRSTGAVRSRRARTSPIEKSHRA